MKNNFQLIHIGGPYGDCTNDYETSFDKPFKVKDLLSIVEAQKDEWGSIQFFVPYSWPYNSFEVEYKHSIIDYKFPERIFNAKIKEITAHGGWSLMDYIVTLESRKIDFLLDLWYN